LGQPRPDPRGQHSLSSSRERTVSQIRVRLRCRSLYVALSRLVGLLLVSLALLVLGMGSPAMGRAAGDMPPWPGFCYERDRFGFWDVAGRIDQYDVEQLHAGWYKHWKVVEDPPHPAGMRFVQLVRISDDGPFEDAACSACPTWDEVHTIAQLNPGSLWLIGNEPDRQDYVEADRYAELYHEFYTFLKAEDPVSQVGVGGVVQPTPIRLQYLDMILDAYQTQYTETMPVDVWNVHNYVLREGATGWGCGIPPGTDPHLAIEYRIQDHDNMEYWTGHLISMRAWMRDRGYQDRPLIISEFGILMPWFYGYDYPRVRDFMLATFDWMRTTTDTLTGSPADDYRLVQAWAWYSLAQSTFEGFPVESHLFDPVTKSITSLGLEFGAYAAPLTTPFPGTIDLQPVGIRHTRPVPEGGTLVTMTITADVYNGGATEATDVLVWFERDGAQAGEDTILSIAPGAVDTATVVWPDLTPGQIYQVTVTVEADEQTVECNPYNNDLTDLLLVPKHWVYLPRIFRHG
jgi:hypothetical protein